MWPSMGKFRVPQTGAQREAALAAAAEASKEQDLQAAARAASAKIDAEAAGIRTEFPSDEAQRSHERRQQAARERSREERERLDARSQFHAAEVASLDGYISDSAEGERLRQATESVRSQQHLEEQAWVESMAGEVPFSVLKSTDGEARVDWSEMGKYLYCSLQFPNGDPSRVMDKPPFGCETSKSGNSRQWTDHERSLVWHFYDKYKGPGAKADLKPVVMRLQSEHATLFGPGTPCKPQGITTRDVTNITKHPLAPKATMHGRPKALSEATVLQVIALLGVIVATKVTRCTAPMLQPFALGAIVALGFGAVIATERGRGRFCASRRWICDIAREHGWTWVAPCSDSRKLPPDAEALCWAMVLRVAYFVYEHKLLPELVWNYDHTGLNFMPGRGKMWISEEQKKANDKSLQGLGDKRQYTLLAGSNLAGHLGPHQLVVDGSTPASCPKIAGMRYEKSAARGSFASGMLSRKSQNDPSLVATGCFVPVAVSGPTIAPNVAILLCGIMSVCATYNHWSNHVTSMAFIKDVFAPTVKATIAQLLLDKPGCCLPYGTQVVVLIVDVWWGWLNAEFRLFIKTYYPWIRLVYCPACCTPIGQPMDAGIIAMIKAFLRACYSNWATKCATYHVLKLGVNYSTQAVEALKLDFKRGPVSTNLLQWSADVHHSFHANQARHERIRHCWQSTKIHRAFEQPVQLEAFSRLSELFPNMSRSEFGHDDAPPPESSRAQPEAWMGQDATDLGPAILDDVDGGAASGAASGAAGSSSDPLTAEEIAQAQEAAEMDSWIDWSSDAVAQWPVAPEAAVGPEAAGPSE